jgi:1-aminocyclopropane-1-carboxylate deaminase
VWDQKSGNFRDAIDAGMELRDNISPGNFKRYFKTAPQSFGPSSARDYVVSDINHLPADKIMFIPQGGAWPGAEVGVAGLANELILQLDELRKQPGALHFPRKRPLVLVAAGTGATAFYLAKHLRGKCRVVAVPVAGDDVYLREQIRWLQESHRATSIPKLQCMDYQCEPEILRSRIRSSFADIRGSKLLVWRELERAAAGEFHFDLIYAPVAFEEMWLAIDENRITLDTDIVYLHSGGLEGNSSMLDRFAYKKLITNNESAEIQRLLEGN